METFLKQIESFVSSGSDQHARQVVLDVLKQAQYRIETPWDTLQRFAGIHLEIAAARIAVNLGIFKHLWQNETPMSVKELSKPEHTGIHEDMLARVLRHLAATGMIKEAAKDTFAATAITKTLAEEGYEAGIKHFFDSIGPVFQELPSWLHEHKYEDITDPSKTPFNKAFGTPLPVFMWMPTEAPERSSNLQKVMRVQQEGVKPWFAVWPLETEAGNFDVRRSPVLVDVGGGFGQQCMGLLQAYPALAGKLCLQDLPQTLEHVPPLPGVEKQVENFFEPNQTKGAKFYYLRSVLHDHPDERALVILQHLKAALADDSVILIDEMVVPNQGAHWQATQIDLTMMASLASRERTEEQWRSLIDRAGLKVVNIFTYVTPKQDSIIACVPK